MTRFLPRGTAPKQNGDTVVHLRTKRHGEEFLGFARAGHLRHT